MRRTRVHTVNHLLRALASRELLRNNRKRMRQLARVIMILIGLAATAGAAERAWYGFHIKPETAGFVLNPIVQSVRIDMIAPNSPATAHGIRIGDEILEADGTRVPGARALALVSILKKHPGETLQLLLRRPSGESYRVEIVGIKKPES